MIDAFPTGRVQGQNLLCLVEQEEAVGALRLHWVMRVRSHKPFLCGNQMMA